MIQCAVSRPAGACSCAISRPRSTSGSRRPTNTAPRFTWPPAPRPTSPPSAPGMAHTVSAREKRRSTPTPAGVHRPRAAARHRGDRSGRGGRLPPLVSREDIRGDLHMHTNYSDGRDTLAAMVQAAAALGYEYIAITDHSERAAAARTADARRARAAARRDRAPARALPALAILHGIEVDIMPDGRLDFDDEVLESLDIVLASLHDRAGHDGARLTRRCLAAIAHPLVNVITHPANRLVGRDPGYDLDFAAVYAAAAETGTALEIDGAPSHLDMDGERARAASPPGSPSPSTATATRRAARPADAARDRHRAARLGRAAPRPEHAAARGGPGVHRRQAAAEVAARRSPPDGAEYDLWTRRRRLALACAAVALCCRHLWQRRAALQRRRSPSPQVAPAGSRRRRGAAAEIRQRQGLLRRLHPDLRRRRAAPKALGERARSP